MMFGRPGLAGSSGPINRFGRPKSPPCCHQCGQVASSENPVVLRSEATGNQCRECFEALAALFRRFREERDEGAARS